MGKSSYKYVVLAGVLHFWLSFVKWQFLLDYFLNSAFLVYRADGEENAMSGRNLVTDFTACTNPCVAMC